MILPPSKPKPAQAPTAAQAMPAEQGTAEIVATVKKVFPQIGFQIDDDLLFNKCRSWLEGLRTVEQGWDARAR